MTVLLVYLPKKLYFQFPQLHMNFQNIIILKSFHLLKELLLAFGLNLFTHAIYILYYIFNKSKIYLLFFFIFIVFQILIWGGLKKIKLIKCYHCFHTTRLKIYLIFIFFCGLRNIFIINSLYLESIITHSFCYSPSW